MKKALLMLLFLLSLFPKNSFATTEFITTCNKSGEDYGSISAWEAATDDVADLTDGTVKVFSVSSTGTYNRATDNTKAVTFTGGGTGTIVHLNQAGDQALIYNLDGTINTGTVTVDFNSHTFTIDDTGDDAIIVLEIYSTDGELENEAVIGGVTTSTTNFRWVRGADGHRIDSSKKLSLETGGNTPDVCATWSQGGGWYICKAQENNIHITDLCIDHDTTGRTIFGENNQSGLVLKNLIMRTNTTGSFGGIGGSAYAENVVLYANGSSGRGITAEYGHVFDMNHVTVAGFSKCYELNNTAHTINNSVGFNCTVDWTTNYGGSVTGYNNASEDTTAKGTDPVISIDPADEFVSETDDFHLAAGSTALKDGGYSLSGTVDYDIEGDARSGTWDIGADEYISATRTRLHIIQ